VIELRKHIREKLGEFQHLGKYILNETLERPYTF
jgi:hypothetical protein